MPTPLQPNNFDLLRLFAASQVVLIHSTKHLQLTENTFYSIFSIFHGVPIFFALSGFLISAAWERNPNLAVYAKNRILRIFPGLWACIGMTIVIATLFGFSFISAQGLTWTALQGVGLIYTPGFLDNFGFGSYNGSLWTIPVELQFYVALPVLYLISTRIGNPTGWAVAGLIAFAVAAYIYLINGPDLGAGEPEPIKFKLLRYSFIPHIYLFFAGVILQRTQAYASPLIRGKGLFWLTGYVSYVWITPDSDWADLFGLLILGITAVSLAYTAPGLSRKVLGKTDISYGVYIYHGLLINVFVELGKTGDWLFGVGVFLATYIAGWVSWVVVEKPCIKRKTKTIRSLSPG